MANKGFNPTLLEEGLGALSIAASIVTSPLSRPWYSKWGATETEENLTLPGDELVPDPVLTANRVISIEAPADVVWPWLLQLGQGRGGFYSYQRLENMIGCDIHNADHIVPEFQDLKVGDLVRLGPKGMPAFNVAAIEPGSALILRGDMPDANGKTTTWIWIFFLVPVDDQTTRLILRTRLEYASNFGNTLMWRVFTDPISFNMERKMLQGIKARAEASVSNNHE
jgi:hypothetical protein